MSECGNTSDFVVCLVNSLVHGLQTFPDLPSLFPRSSQLPNFAPYLPIFPLTACEPGSQARKQSGPLPVCGKIFERVVHSRAVNFLVKKKFFNQNQFGFIEDKNTTIAPMKVIEKIQDELDQSNIAIGNF